MLANGSPKKLQPQVVQYSDYKNANAYNLKLRLDKGAPIKLEQKVENVPKKSMVKKSDYLNEIKRLSQLNSKLITQVDYWK